MDLGHGSTLPIPVARAALAAGCLFAGAAVAGEGTLPPPSGDAVLVVSGAIERTTDGIAALLDVATLEALGDGDAHGEDPCIVPLGALLAFLGAHGDHLELRTLDERRANISTAAGTDDLVLVITGAASRPTKQSVAVATIDARGTPLIETAIERVVRIRVD